MNWKFVLRGTLLALGTLVALGFVGYRSLPRLLPSVPFGPTPRPPAITALRGNMPSGWSGLEAYATYEDSDPEIAGSGFVFKLPSGSMVAATAAHSYDLSGGLHSIQLGSGNSPLVLDVLHGAPGEPRTLSMNLTRDYVLLVVQGREVSAQVLIPDERGGPQPGERVVLYPGFGAENGERWGTVLESDRTGAWVIMDDAFEPGLMSGSPIVSSHTGQVVGMALAAGLREGHTVIGLHPIGSLVEKALDATDFFPLSNYSSE